MTKMLLGVAATIILSVACASSSRASPCPAYCCPGGCRGDAYYVYNGVPFAQGYYYQGPNHYHWRYRLMGRSLWLLLLLRSRLCHLVLLVRAGWALLPSELLSLSERTAGRPTAAAVTSRVSGARRTAAGFRVTIPTSRANVCTFRGTQWRRSEHCAQTFYTFRAPNGSGSGGDPNIALPGVCTFGGAQ